jgi:23S rRNA (cytosine1962-C5)-methyltransferase
MVEVFNTIHLRRGKEESLQHSHPWVFSGAIERITEGVKPLAEGDIVDVVTKQGEFIARGHWQIGSIAVRVLLSKRRILTKHGGTAASPRH